jgi:hypothetical protein
MGLHLLPQSDATKPTVSAHVRTACETSTDFVHLHPDSRPIPNPSVDPLWLPDQEDMSLMLSQLRAYIQDGNGDFASGGIYCKLCADHS